MSADVFKHASPMRRRVLSDEHRAHLISGSNILPGIVDMRGYYTLKPAAVKLLVGENVLKNYALQAESWMGIPIYRPDGQYYGDVIRLFGAPENIPKYIWPTGQTQVIDIHPSVRDRLDDPNYSIFLTEGIKKSDAVISKAQQEGLKILPIAVNGCWGWMAKTSAGSQACPDFRDVPINKRIVYVNSDSDFRTNDSVRRGWSEAALYFSSKTEEKAKSLITITPPYGIDKQGVDDYFRRGGTLQSLLELAETPKLALLDVQVRQQEPPRPIAFRTGLEVIREAPLSLPYLMEPVMPKGSIVLLAGHSGAYKTWHCMSLMLDGAFGYSWSDHPGIREPAEPFTSIYVNKEMSRSMWDVRLKQLAKAQRHSEHPDFEDILNERIILVEEADIDLASQEQRDRLEDLIVGTGAAMVFLDSLSMCWTGDENSAQEVGLLYVQLRGIVERTDVTFGLVHHLIKPGVSNKNIPSKFSVRGSGQIVQQADSALLFAILDKDTPDDHPLISVTHTKTRTTAEMPTWVTEFQDNDGMFTTLLYRSALAERKAAAFASSHGDPEKFAEWVNTALENMPVMHHSTGTGLRTRYLITLLHNSWPDKSKPAPSESTFRRQLDQMVVNGQLEVLETNKKMGDLYRLPPQFLVDTELDDLEEDYV